jgi:NAD(P)H-dependent flavin oxidoreductase YrpB (nitropropane dioxygenase family)
MSTLSHSFSLLAFSPAGHPHPSVAIAASRAGLIGVYNAEVDPGEEALAAALSQLEAAARGPFGLKLRQFSGAAVALAGRLAAAKALRWLILDADTAAASASALADLRQTGCQVLFEVIDWAEGGEALPPHDGLIVKGHEAGGRVGEETTFILLQKALARLGGPIYARGGLGAHGLAAVRAAGAAGAVLDDQLLLLAESPVRLRAEHYLQGFSGLETGLIGERWRVLEKPGFRHVRDLRQRALDLAASSLDAEVTPRLGWDDPAMDLVPVGQAAVFARDFAARYGNLARLARALEAISGEQVALAAEIRPLAKGHGVAGPHGTDYPIVQGPMTRVSDVAGFAEAVATAGGLPLLALALMQPAAVDTLLAEVKARLGDRPWGVGLLGFAPSELVAGQTEVVRRYNPRYALIAGGRPGQAQAMEADGIASYLHVPSPGLLKLFLEQGAERFVFEGRECGGHIGPLASLVLWDLMVSTLLDALKSEAKPERFQVLFAGGIHDALSAAMVAVLAAPLAARGVKIGVLMGTAYLFTREIVESGAVVPGFQEAALACRRTVSLETGPGHASRCALTPFAEQFLEAKKRLLAEGKPGEEIRNELEEMTLGRLRVATKGVDRRGEGGAIVPVPEEEQRQTGMYMIGQVATAIERLSTVAELHHDVCDGATQLVNTRAAARPPAQPRPAPRPADIAVIGIGGVFPKAANVRAYWENLLDRVDAID